MYLENKGGFKFDAYSFKDSHSGRWLVMDAQDLDGDGDLDLVLGASDRSPYDVPPAIAEQWEKSGPSLLILKNTLKK